MIGGIDPGEFHWFPAITGRPQGMVVRPGYLGQKVQDVWLADVAAAGTSQPTATVIARLVNPSRKIGCGFALMFRPQTGQSVSSYSASSVWTPRGFDPSDGNLLHELESSIAVPRMYEMETYLPGVVITAVLGVPTNAAAAPVPGQWILRVRWEPCMPMCDAEANQVYAACVASRDVGPTTALVP